MKEHPQLIPIAKADVVKQGQDVAIFGLGQMLPVAEQLAAELEKRGYSAAVINPRTIKPLDLGTLESFARRAEVVVTLEDHVLAGGFGSIVLEALSDLKIETPVVRVGWPDQFIEHGKPDQLKAKYGLTAAAALERVLPLLSVKQVEAAVA